MEGEILTNRAFLRRPVDEDGLSVAWSHDKAKQLQASGCGVAGLEIRAIAELGQDLAQGEDGHGAIDVPFPKGDTYDIAYEIADKLTSISDVTIDPWRQD